MENRYFFDKRVVKKNLKRYGLIFLCILPILILANVLLAGLVSSTVILVIDIAIGLLGVLVALLIINKIDRNREEKLEQIKRDEQLKKQLELKLKRKEQQQNKKSK